MMKALTTSIYTFSDLIHGGYQYVDKTAGIDELIREYKGQYFLSRPRRFGKSLLVSTLKVIFQGRRELFDGTANGDAAGLHPEGGRSQFPGLHRTAGKHPPAISISSSSS